jgi:hypothetical protein
MLWNLYFQRRDDLRQIEIFILKHFFYRWLYAAALAVVLKFSTIKKNNFNKALSILKSFLMMQSSVLVDWEVG